MKHGVLESAIPVVHPLNHCLLFIILKRDQVTFRFLQPHIITADYGLVHAVNTNGIVSRSPPEVDPPFRRILVNESSGIDQELPASDVQNKLKCIRMAVRRDAQIAQWATIEQKLDFIGSFDFCV